jgi:hypothetical protein
MESALTDEGRMMRRMLLRPGKILLMPIAKLQGTGKGRPEASLIKFYYNKPTLSDLD